METMNVKATKKFFLGTQHTGLQIPEGEILQSKDAWHTCATIHQYEGNHHQEFFYVLFLNRANKVTGYYLASIGGVTGTIADPRLIIKAAALSNCVSMVMCHNHPSGSIKPSRADIELTQKIKQCAEFFDIKVLDHIIITETSEYFSFADDGQL